LSTRPILRGLATAGFGPPFFALVGIVGMLCATASQAEECRDSPRMHVLDGCAIFEHWRDTDGGKGTSLFYYDRGALYRRHVP
jgi:hypothetical protein